MSTMQKQIKLHNKIVDYTLKQSKRARRLRLAVYCDGRLVVSAPRRLPYSQIENFILEKAQWVLAKLDYFASLPKRIFAADVSVEYAQYKEAARHLAEGRLSYFNRFYGFEINRISIKKQKTRWGSCSRKGNLNFNYKIALLPPDLADYIIVHELCHLGQFNHSAKFWHLVSKIFPDYQAKRRQLNSTEFRLN